MRTARGKAYSKPWRVAWYMRDPATGRPVGGGRRAFVHQEHAQRLAAEQRAAGYTVECWRQLPLRGVA